MSFTSKINWLLTWASFKVLKSSLKYKINEPGNEMQMPVQNAVGIYNRIDFITNYCKDKNVLHVGCTDHPYTREKLEKDELLHLLLKRVTKTTIGIDNNRESIAEYKRLTGDNEIYYCDIMKNIPAEISAKQFDIILLSEVLEHLMNPATALNILHDHFNAGAKLLVTVPNYISLSGIAASLNKTESIHPDHYWYFSPYTLSRLFDKDKFGLEEMIFGMYYQKHKKLNFVMERFPYNGDCIIAVFSIKK